MEPFVAFFVVLYYTVEKERRWIMAQKALIWDLDGTLFDSYKVIVPNARQTFLEFGIDYDPDYIRRYTLGIS